MSASACTLRCCLMKDGFENLHKTHMKCTPSQIMLYQLSLNLHKTLNQMENELTFEQITVLDQTICTCRQINFQILKNCNIRIGLNTTANKFYPISNIISLDRLNLGFIHFRKTSKAQFLKYGKTLILLKVILTYNMFYMCN